MAKHPVPNVPFVEAKRKGNKHKPTAIVLRASFTPSTQGAALEIARYWHRDAQTDACHYVVDSGSTYRCIPDGVSSLMGAALQNGTIWVNLCCEPNEDKELFFKSTGPNLLDRAADLVAELCLSHKIRPVKLSRNEQGKWYMWKRRSRGGVIINIEGAFPSKEFMDTVRWKIRQREVNRHE